MAALLLQTLRCTRSSHIKDLRPFGSLLCLRKYQRSRKKKHQEVKALDIKELLSKNESEEIAGLSEQGDYETKPKGAAVTHDSNTWTHSENRLKSLKKTEKSIAVMAVISMLLGYFGIKWMVSAYPLKNSSDEADKQKEQHDPPKPVEMEEVLPTSK